MDDQMQPQNTQNPQTGTPFGSAIPEPHERKYGPLIGIAIIVALLIVGGLYLWGMELVQNDAANESDPMLEELNTQSSSDEVDAIEADLNATAVDSLDSGSGEVESELQVQ